MFCEKCGQEIGGENSFCEHCGARIEKKIEKKSRKKKKPAAVFPGIALILAIVGAGSYLYLTSSGHQCRKNIKLADACMQQEEYEEALAYCEAALELDAGYADAYLREADSYLAMESYGAATAALRKGIENVTERDNGRLSDKLEKVYQTEAEHLIGTWKHNIAERLNLSGEVDVFVEVYDNGTLYLYIDKDAVSEAAGGAWNTVEEMAGGVIQWNPWKSAWKAGGELLAWGAGIGAGKYVDRTYKYTAQEGKIFLEMEIDGETVPITTLPFTIDGDKLQVSEEAPLGGEPWFFDRPAEFKRVE